MAIDGTELRATRRALEHALTDALTRGGHDPSVLKLSAQLGAITAEIGNRYEARRHFRRVAGAGPVVLGVNHPLVRKAEAYLDGTTTLNGTTTPVLPTPSRALVPATANHASRASEPPRRTRQRPLIFVLGTSLAAVALVAAGAASWRHEQGTRVPTRYRAPVAPKQVTAIAAGGAVTVRWQDPSNGTVPFVVSGGVAGQDASLTQQVEPGQTVVVINGLNAGREYCFNVVAIYSAEQMAVSDPACTGH